MVLKDREAAHELTNKNWSHSTVCVYEHIQSKFVNEGLRILKYYPPLS